MKKTTKKSKARAKRKTTRARTSNPTPRGAKRVRVANPSQETKPMAKKSRKSKKSKKSRTSNPGPKKRAKKRSRTSNPAPAARRPARRRNPARRRRNPDSGSGKKGSIVGQLAAASGGGLLVEGAGVLTEYAPVSPAVGALIGGAAGLAVTAGMHMLSRSARDGAMGATAAKGARDLRLALMTKPAAKTADKDKKGLQGFGAVQRRPNELGEASPLFTGQVPKGVAARR